MRFTLKHITYVVYFIALASVFALIYYGGYYYAVNHLKSDNLVTIDDTLSNTPGINSITAVNETDEQIVLAKSKYIEERLILSRFRRSLRRAQRWTVLHI